VAEDLNAEIAKALNESRSAHTQPAKSCWEGHVERLETISSNLKQSATWSFAMPTACMKALKLMLGGPGRPDGAE
jgi:hypothetical protein